MRTKVECNIGDAMTNMPQSRNQLEDWRSKMMKCPDECGKQ